MKAHSLHHIIEDNFQIQAPEGLYSEGLVIGGIFAFQIRGLLYGRALNGGVCFWNLKEAWLDKPHFSFLFFYLEIHLPIKPLS